MAGVYIIAHRLDDGWAPPCKIGISASINAVEFVRSITSGPGALPASDSGES